MNKNKLLAIALLVILSVVILLVVYEKNPQVQPPNTNISTNSSLNTSANISTYLLEGINCTEKGQFIFSNSTGYFTSAEQAIIWCNNCLKSNAIPSLSNITGPFCNKLTPDSGKACTDRKQCESACLAENISSTSGKCAPTLAISGCVYHLIYGNAVRWCFDTLY